MSEFVKGESLCMYTLMPVKECPHCLALPPSKDFLEVSEVDRERGVITFDLVTGDRIGSTFDSFLDEEGIREEVEALAAEKMAAIDAGGPACLSCAELGQKWHLEWENNTDSYGPRGRWTCPNCHTG